MSELPAHSPLGASSAERWMNCPGSVALKHSLGPVVDDDPDYRREGTQAHTLAAYCLEQGVDAADVESWECESTLEMASAVQVYLDYVRSLPGEQYVETHVHRPEFHSLFFGTLDHAAITPLRLRFTDYKHGVGVVVEVVENAQLKYYAYGFIGEDPQYADDEEVELAIVQPRAIHEDGPIRSWTTTVGEIRQWARDVLKPHMDAALTDHYLDIGKWCRFCPAKLVCPAMENLAKRTLAFAEQYGIELVTTKPGLAFMDNETLGQWYDRLDALMMFKNAIEAEVLARLMRKEDVPYTKLVAKWADRVWKDAAPLVDKFGFDDAYEPPKLRSPAQIEALKGGKEFVSEWAFQPHTGERAARADSKYKAVTPQTTSEKFAEALAAMQDAE